MQLLWRIYGGPGPVPAAAHNDEIGSKNAT